MKILSLGGSTSSSSINRQLANHAANLTVADIDNATVTDLSLRDLDLPIYSEDEEKANGYPPAAQHFIDQIVAHDAIVISLAEHNGSYTAAFKNIYDWASRIEQKVWQEKPMLLMATSPGGRGGATVLATAKETFSRMGANIAATFSLPSFYDHFSDQGINDATLSSQLAEAVAALLKTISNS